MNQHDLDNLRVAHRLKDAAGHGVGSDQIAGLNGQGLHIDTCLRQLWIDFSAATPVSGADLMHGASAYNFLLQTVTGLNSAVPGETNIQGQFRCAWKRWRKTAPANQVWRLNRLMETLLADSQTIRRNYLENLGGASYGSLTRKLLQPQPNARILFAGSGKFARSMLPLFSKWETAVWNHRLHPGLDIGTRLFGPEETAAAAAWTTQLVLTTPPDDHNDQPWVRLATRHGINRVVHLGRRRAERGCWQTLPSPITFFDLDDVFDLRRRQATLRDLHTLRARRACERMAGNKRSDNLVAGSLVAQGI